MISGIGEPSQNMENHVAAELVRLHCENERLHAELAVKDTVIGRMCGEIERLKAKLIAHSDYDELQAERYELLAALVAVDSEIVLEGQLKEIVDGAIAKAEGK